MHRGQTRRIPPGAVARSHVYIGQRAEGVHRGGAPQEERKRRRGLRFCPPGEGGGTEGVRGKSVAHGATAAQLIGQPSR